MPELTIEDRRTALNFATALEFMAAGIPNAFVRRGAHRLVNQIRMRYRFTPAEKKDYIVKIAKDRGGVSIADLVRITEYTQPETFRLVKELESEGRVEFRGWRPPGEKGGRPAALLFAIET